MGHEISRLTSIACAVSLAAGVSPSRAQGVDRDSVYRRMLDFPSLVKGGAVTPHWLGDGRSFWYLAGGPDSTVVLRVDPVANRVEAMADVARVRRAVAGAVGYSPRYRGLPFSELELTDDGRAIEFELDDRRWQLDLGTYGVRRVGSAAARLVKDAEPEFPSPDGRWVAHFREHNLWLRSTLDRRSIQITTSGVDDNAWLPGQLVGLAAPMPWSPDGNRLLAVKANLRGVGRIPVVHWLKPEEEQVDWVRYPRTGGAIAQAELYAVDVRRRGTTRLDTGSERDQRLWPLTWRSDGREVYLLKSDRLMKRVDLLAADPETGHTRILVTDRQESFIEGLAMAPATLFHPLADGERFIWRSERDGWSHLYLYRMDGVLERRLTQGGYPVDRLVGVDEKAAWVYYLARPDRARPYDVHLMRVELGGGRPTRLTEAPGEHAIAMAPGFEYFIDTHSTVSTPPVVELRSADGSLIRVLSRADVSDLVALGWRAPEEFTVKAADGVTDLYGVLYRPFDFDPSRRYPVIDLQYMGNFVQSAPHRFVGTWLGDEAQALTQLGFIVYIVDARGTTGRGKAFQDFTYGNVGRIEVPDHVAALRALAATRPWLDTTRVGITGYSWGGYFTIRAMLTAPEVFRVGVSGAPVVDFLADPRPIEPYMGMPQDESEAYERGSNLRLADRLRGKLLIAIGTSDVNVTFNHTMRMAHAFFRAGKYFDLIVLPEESHTLSPAARAYYLEARARYFVEHLRPGS
ncbi:MAG: DPP IV N-terminal domain-containing protein [Gemmatimonadales bacterium]